MQYYIDIDDFMEKNNGLDILYQIKAKVPNIKFNLFTIIGECSDNFIAEIKKIDWIDMIPHGWRHDTSRECENWNYRESLDYLERIDRYGLTKGFKAPGWQISDGMYRALMEKGYWVADQAYNNERRSKELKAYLLDSPDKHHYHIKNVCGNGLGECFNEILNLKGDFKFIKELQ